MEMVTLTDEVRNQFYQSNTITIHSLYSELINPLWLDKEKAKMRHNIRGVLNTLSKRKEIVRISEGTYKLIS